MIELSGIRKSFDKKQVLKGIDLKVDEGNFISIIGPSGVGKTTLLRMICGLSHQDAGVLDIMGSKYSINPGNDISLRRRIAFVPQKPVPLSGTVRENVSYPLITRGEKEDEIEEKVDTALKMVSLSDFSNSEARSLSGGELQRMAFARAIVYKPELLLLDEFTAHLDPGNVKLLESALLDYMKNNKATVIAATHNMFQAKRISEKTAFMLDGQFIEADTTDTIFNDPKDERTRAFVNGEMVF